MAAHRLNRIVQHITFSHEVQQPARVLNAHGAPPAEAERGGIFNIVVDSTGDMLRTWSPFLALLLGVAALFVPYETLSSLGIVEFFELGGWGLLSAGGDGGGFVQPHRVHESALLHLIDEGPNGWRKRVSFDSVIEPVTRLSATEAQSIFARKYHMKRPVIVENIRGMKCYGRFHREHLLEAWGNRSLHFGASADIVLNQGNGPRSSPIENVLAGLRRRTQSAAIRARDAASFFSFDSTTTTALTERDLEALEAIYAPQNAVADEVARVGAGGAASVDDFDEEFGGFDGDDSDGDETSENGNEIESTNAEEDEFGEYFQVNREDERDGAAPYAFDRNSEDVVVDLLSQVEMPRIFPHGERRGYHSYLLIGVSGTGIEWHMHADGWNGLACGHKRWFLLPPTSIPPRYPRPLETRGGMLNWFRRFYHDFSQLEGAREIVQRPGDVLYVPEGWYHATINIGETLGVSSQLLSVRLYLYSLRHCLCLCLCLSLSVTLTYVLSLSLSLSLSLPLSHLLSAAERRPPLALRDDGEVCSHRDAMGQP